MRARFLILALLAGCQGSVSPSVTASSDLSQVNSGDDDLAVSADDDGGAGDLGGADLVSGAGDLAHPRLNAQTVTFALDAGAFPATRSHPNALVYIPSNFDPTPPLNVIVYIHGFDNCVTNIVRATDGTCTDGGVTRDAYSLAAQLETSGKNALLLAPEVAFEAATGDPGNLKYKGTFRALLQETLGDLAPIIGAKSVADVGELIVASHSGGYTAADDVVDSTGITAREVWMFDSLYSSTVTDDFELWVKQDLGTLRPPPYRRFATFYTIIDNACSGTDCNSETMAADVRALYPLDAGVVVDETSAAVTWTDDVYRHGFLCKHSSLAHNDIPRYYFVHLLSTSQLPNK